MAPKKSVYFKAIQGRHVGANELPHGRAMTPGTTALRGGKAASFARRRKTPGRQVTGESIVAGWQHAGGSAAPVAHPIGREGLSGAAFLVPAKATRALLAGLRGASATSRREFYSAGTVPPGDVVVKLVRLHNAHQSPQMLLAEFAREVSCLADMNLARPTEVRARGVMHTFDVRAVTPRLYMAGLDAGNDVLALVEDAVEGRTVWQAVKKRTEAASAALIASIEKATLSLWLAGFLHMDLHADNALVTPRGEVKLIDFGRVVRVPAGVRTALVAALERGNNANLLHTFWARYLEPLAQASVHDRELPAYRNVDLGAESEANALALARGTRGRAAAVAALNAARLSTWMFPATPQRASAGAPGWKSVIAGVALKPRSPTPRRTQSASPRTVATSLRRRSGSSGSSGGSAAMSWSPAAQVKRRASGSPTPMSWSPAAPARAVRRR